MESGLDMSWTVSDSFCGHVCLEDCCRARFKCSDVFISIIFRVYGEHSIIKLLYNVFLVIL